MSVFTLTILSDGQAIASDYAVISVQITQEVNRIPYAEIVLIDGSVASRQFAISDSKVFEPGKEVEIKIRYEGTSGSDKSIFKGLVVSQGISADDKSSTLSVILKDKALAMTQTKSNQVFIDKSDTDIIKQIADNHNIAAAIDDTEFKHKEMTQYDCCDWDFILARADSNGLLLTVNDGALSAKTIKAPSSAAKIKIDYGIDTIYSFDFQANGESQYAEISALNWDYRKQAVAKVSESGNQNLTPGNLSGSTLADKLGGKSFDLYTTATAEQEEMKSWAKAKLNRSQLSLVRGVIAIAGRGDISLLDVAELKGFGARFNGKAMITGIGHRITPGSWMTDIQFGLADRWLLSNTRANSLPASGLLPAVSGLQIAVVSDIKADPDKELRIKVKLPTPDDSNPYTIWARCTSPDAGKERGFFFRPEIGDEVVVGFINDDPRQAVVMGALFGSKNAMPKRFGQADEKNNLRGIVSKQGMVIGFDDEKKIVYIETPAKNTVTLDDDGKKIELKDQHGNSIRMDQDGITLKSAKDFKIDASGNVEIKGQQVDIK